MNKEFVCYYKYKYKKYKNKHKSAHGGVTSSPRVQTQTPNLPDTEDLKLNTSSFLSPQDSLALGKTAKRYKMK